MKSGTSLAGVEAAAESLNCGFARVGFWEVNNGYALALCRHHH